MTKKGTPLIPSSLASRSSARTSSENSPASSADRARSGSTPTSAASSIRVSRSPMARPSTKYAAMSRSFIADCNPSAAARWIRRWASKVLPRLAMSSRYRRPSPAAASTTLWLRACACSRLIRYLRASASSGLPCSSGSALGLSSKLRNSTATSARCSNRSRAVSKRRLPM